MKKVQEAVNQVEDCGRKWGFRFSVEKIKTVLRKIGENVKMTLYGKSLENVKRFKFLGVYFDTRLTWREHIMKIIEM